MNKSLTLSIIVLLLSACVPGIVPPASPTIPPIPVIASTVTPVSEPSQKHGFKKVSIVDQYVIEVPEDFTVNENLLSSTTTIPIYRIETSNGGIFTIAVHPYIVSSSPVPGKCIVSTDLDKGTASAPIFCEGLQLVQSFHLPSGWVVNYGSSISDLSLACTMNSPCPVEVTPEKRYSITYVFVVADKTLGTVLEFYAGDAFRSSLNEVNGFEGVGATLYDTILPSLTAQNP